MVDLKLRPLCIQQISTLNLLSYLFMFVFFEFVKKTLNAYKHFMNKHILGASLKSGFIFHKLFLNFNIKCNQKHL